MSERFRRKHIRIADNILDLVEKHPSVVSDYRKLIQYYWFYVDKMERFVPMDVLMKLTQPESISRAFRKLVEQGKIDVPERTKRARLDQEDQYRDHYRR